MDNHSSQPSDDKVEFSWTNSSDSVTIGVTIRLLSGTEYALSVLLSDTLGQLKEKMEAVHGVPKCQQKYIFAGRDMISDDKAIQDYGIKEGSLMHLVLNLRC